MNLNEKQLVNIKEFIAEKASDQFEDNELAEYVIQVLQSDDCGSPNTPDFKIKVQENLEEFFKDSDYTIEEIMNQLFHIIENLDSEDENEQEQQQNQDDDLSLSEDDNDNSYNNNSQQNNSDQEDNENNWKDKNSKKNQNNDQNSNYNNNNQKNRQKRRNNNGQMNIPNFLNGNQNLGQNNLMMMNNFMLNMQQQQQKQQQQTVPMIDLLNMDKDKLKNFSQNPMQQTPYNPLLPKPIIQQQIQENNNKRRHPGDKVYSFKNEKQNSIFVKNLPKELNNVSKLTEAFKTFGEIQQIQSFHHQQIAVIKFYSKNQAEKAIKMNGRLFKKHTIVVSLTPDPTEKHLEPSEIPDEEPQVQKQVKYDQNQGYQGRGRGGFQQQQQMSMGFGRGRGRGQFQGNTQQKPVGQAPQQVQSGFNLEEQKKMLLLQLTDKFRILLGLKNKSTDQAQKDALLVIIKSIMDIKKEITECTEESAFKEFKANKLANNDYDITLYVRYLTEDQNNYQFLSSQFKEFGQIEKLILKKETNSASIKFKDFLTTEKAFQGIKDLKMYFNNEVIYDHLSKEIDVEKINKSKEILKQVKIQNAKRREEERLKLEQQKKDEEEQRKQKEEREKLEQEEKEKENQNNNDNQDQNQNDNDNNQNQNNNQDDEEDEDNL